MTAPWWLALVGLCWPYLLAALVLGLVAGWFSRPAAMDKR